MKFSANVMFSKDMLELGRMSIGAAYEESLVRKLLVDIAQSIQRSNNYDLTVRDSEALRVKEIRVSLHCMGELEYRTLNEKAKAYDRLLANKMEWGI